MPKAKRGVGRPKAAAQPKAVERTIVTQARIEPELPVTPKPPDTTVAHDDQMNTKPSVEPLPPPKPWVEIIQGNRDLSRGMAVEYIAPTLLNVDIEINIEETDVAQELEFWEYAVILFTLGGNLTMTAVRKFMETSWNFVALPNLYYNDAGYFIVKFKSYADMEKVMAQGPYFIYGKPLFLKPWTPDFEIKEDLLRVLPIWITLPNLPLHLWGKSSISKISSAIGKPITTGECTAQKLRISYARVLVEVDITQKPRDSIVIKDHLGKKIEQRIEYEWKPLYCHSCLKVGHDCSVKKVSVKQAPKVWKPKLKTDEPGVVEPPANIGKSDKPGEENETQKESHSEENWTVVTKKGKTPMATPKDNSAVLFPNPFTHLRIGDCPIGGQSSVQ
ncbi:uncharacterized protein LOC131648869 [Vicia villosa]|uniref:uncharacterized protein LOC131648869 n=1 Tax=Vicia villosa TaxID=3911 RepID=UPI00273BB676|nr:uncharacterized protein LOC131648869 [Vicia villosa]